MSGSEIGIALVGCGQIAETHLKAIQGCGRARVTWCVDVDPDRAKLAADRYGKGSHGTDFDSVLNDSEVDAVVVCLPYDLHDSFTCRALEAGKHVLIEKPMAMNEAEAREMAKAAARANKNLMVGHVHSVSFLPPGGSSIDPRREDWRTHKRCSPDLLLGRAVVDGLAEKSRFLRRTLSSSLRESRCRCYAVAP